ncbi:hypothetical protein [Spirosoma sp. KNUC1025]|nr:hypothetical protein LN737_08620 [Spirosoma sp. KNUC1025]
MKLLLLLFLGSSVAFSQSSAIPGIHNNEDYAPVSASEIDDLPLFR